MHLSSTHSTEEQRFIVTNIRQSSDYSAGTVYWLGARLVPTSAETAKESSREDSSHNDGVRDHLAQRAGGRLAEGFLWVDGSAVTYQGWSPYNESEGWDEERCLGVQVGLTLDIGTKNFFW